MSSEVTQRKRYDHVYERWLREEFYRAIDNRRLTIHETVNAMRRLSCLTRQDFARHVGIGLVALKQIESGRTDPKVSTLNRMADMFGLEVRFVRKAKGGQ